MGFLAGKFPEFSSQALKDAQSAAQKDDIPNAVQLLKAATTAVRNLKAQKIEAPASFFSNAINILIKICTTPASASTGPEMHNTREALVDYKSALERDKLPLPHGRPINNPPIEIAHLTIEGGTSAILNLFPPARTVDQLIKVTDVRVQVGKR